ncbi:MAG: AMIN domain-containing protein [Xenococcaceae cyanobacterium MO_188.B29]|nr:AMIN domain-containing protein [Xenococcaceae cyanobacterium MO_188.B29]
MKQQLGNSIILDLLMLSLFGQLPAQAEVPETKILSDLPAITVEEWLSQLNNYPAIVAEIEVRSTMEGVEIILTTTNDKQLQGITSIEDNNLIIDIPNAQLDWQERELVRDNPADGIASVTVTALGENNIRVVVTGLEGTPTGETVQTPQGLTISATPPIPVADTETPDEVIDIIVTAQKQPERLQDVPISITTFSQQEIEDARIDSFRDVAANTPNFFTTVGDRAFNIQTIRGLGNAGFLTRDSISFFIDDVPYENVHQLLPGALFDLERVKN